MKWIKVTEQFMDESNSNFPGYDKPILFYVPKNDTIRMGTYTRELGFVCNEMGDYYNLEVSHWMNLPERPKENK